MKHRLYLPLAIAVLCLFTWTAHAQLQRSTPPNRVWEYKEVQLSARIEATPTLNQMGAEGWELVGVTSGCISSPTISGTCNYWAYFKRAK